MRIGSFSSAHSFVSLLGVAIAATSSTLSTAQTSVSAAPTADSAYAQTSRTAQHQSTSQTQRITIEKNYGKLPISFEANRGPANGRMKFLARGSGYELYLTGQEAILALHTPQSGSQGEQARPGVGQLGKAYQPRLVKTDLVRMQLRGANPGAQPGGVDLLTGTANYFIGNDRSKWRTGVPTYSKVRFSAVYPGIDLIYYGNQSQLEYDFVVAPDASPKAIRLHFAGARKVTLTADGNLAISAQDGQIAFHKPVVYQEIDGRRLMIPGQFTLLDAHSVAFSVGRYDHSRPLIIDPVLVYSTYVGGSSGAGVSSMAVDKAGNVYVTGTTGSFDLPVTAGAYQTTNRDLYGSPTVFIAKLNAAGTALVYSTYLGGTGQPFNGFLGGYDGWTACGPDNIYTTFAPYYSSCGDYAGAIAVDGSGNAYVTGSTFSSDFPVSAGAFQSTSKSAPSIPTGFVTKLDATGTTLLYSTYLGGSGYGYGGGDWGSTITVDAAGDAYVAGHTFSHDFPISAGAFQTSAATSNLETDGFVTKLNPTGTALLYSTYLGGSGYDIPYWYETGLTVLPGGDGVNGIAIDGAGNAYVTGVTYGGFPTTPGAYQTTFEPPQYCNPDNYFCAFASMSFVAKINPTGTDLLYSTCLGGSGLQFGQTQGYAIAIDGSGNAYVTGIAAVPDFPVTPGAFKETGVGAFITKLNSAGSDLVYSTFLSDSVGISAIALDGAGNAYVTGSAGDGLPVTPGAFQSTLSGSSDAFLSELNASGSALVYSTYLGGSGGASASSFALDGAGNVYIAGSAGPDFPVTAGALQTGITGSGDGFVAKLNLAAATTSIPTTTTLVVDVNPQPLGMPNTFSVTVTSVGSSSVPVGDVILNIDGAHVTTLTLDGSGKADYTISSLTLGSHVIQAIYEGSSTFEVSNAILTESVIVPAAPTFSPAGGKYIASVVVTLSEATPAATVYFTTNGSSPTVASPVYTGPFTIASGYVVVKAIAALYGYAPTPIVQAAYSIVPQTPTPVISLAPGLYPVGQTVTITDAIPTATIRYTTNGSTPTTHSNWYNGPFPLTGDETIRAIAISTTEASSNMASATYTTFTQPPTFSIDAGKFLGSVTVTISDPSPAPYATIHYTLDGTDPTSASPVYSGPLTFSSYMRLRARVIFKGYPPTAISEAIYYLYAQTPAPVISPASGAYPVGQAITITDANPAATIRYTTDGSTPTTHSNWYHGSIVLTGSETVKAIAVSTGEANSDVASATYAVH